MRLLDRRPPLLPLGDRVHVGTYDARVDGQVAVANLGHGAVADELHAAGVDLAVALVVRRLASDGGCGASCSAGHGLIDHVLHRDHVVRVGLGLRAGRTTGARRSDCVPGTAGDLGVVGRLHVLHRDGEVRVGLGLRDARNGGLDLSDLVRGPAAGRLLHDRVERVGHVGRAIRRRRGGFVRFVRSVGLDGLDRVDVFRAAALLDQRDDLALALAPGGEAVGRGVPAHVTPPRCAGG